MSVGNQGQLINNYKFAQGQVKRKVYGQPNYVILCAVLTRTKSKEETFCEFLSDGSQGPLMFITILHKVKKR